MLSGSNAPLIMQIASTRLGRRGRHKSIYCRWRFKLSSVLLVHSLPLHECLQVFGKLRINRPNGLP
jgi:hypothetical protein